MYVPFSSVTPVRREHRPDPDVHFVFAATWLVVAVPPSSPPPPPPDASATAPPATASNSTTTATITPTGAFFLVVVWDRVRAAGVVTGEGVGPVPPSPPAGSCGRGGGAAPPAPPFDTPAGGAPTGAVGPTTAPGADAAAELNTWAAPSETACLGWASTDTGALRASHTISPTNGMRDDPPTS